jgi:FdhD protein
MIESADEIRHQTLTSAPKGVIARMTIPDQRAEVLEGRGRGMAGNTGCGICGTREIEDVLTPLPRVTADIRFDPATVHEALARIAPLQIANQRTGAMHAAAFADITGEIQAIREDVGRHNALDKLIGALAREGRDPAQGFAILTSRCSFELVRKAAHAGIAMLVTVSAPTALAIELADQANVTVVALARGDSMTVFADNAGRLGINP